MRKLSKFFKEWGPLLVSLGVLAIYMLMLIGNLSIGGRNTEPSGATAATYALITAAAVFARILEGGTCIRWKDFVVRLNLVVGAWAGYSTAVAWLESETGPNMPFQYRVIWMIALGVALVASLALATRGLDKN